MPVDPDIHQVTSVFELATRIEYQTLFDHAWLICPNSGTADFLVLIRRAFDATKPGGTLILTTPFGAPTGRADRAPCYGGSLRRLLEPLFDLTAVDLVDGCLAVRGIRREAPSRVPELALDHDERLFERHERRLRDRIDALADQQVRSGLRYRGAIARADRLRADLDRVNRELAGLRRKLRRIRPLYVLPLAGYRRLRRLQRALLRPGRTDPGASTGAVSPPAGPSVAAAKGAPAPATGLEPVIETWQDRLRREFDQWVAAARAADGDEVVVMFSGTTFIQEHRANRPIRLTRVYLARSCPVFFNYYRWNPQDPLPEHPDPLLFQSPIDATPMFLDALATADFGAKKKIFFASFPHELMVRYLTVAAQHGWTTVYDARDDWEEFAKVGMAKWYHPGYERYVAVHADLVSAVSRPLARKISALAGNRVVHVSPNGLDPSFPTPSGPRQASGPTVVGYFGHLTDKWFDWPLVIAAAKRYPDFVFELAGHQAPKLDLPPNIRLLGMMGHRDLAERSRTWSVALIPFKNGPLADAVDPIKIYEYLHLRLPVLTTYFPQCRDYPGTTVTEGSEDFLRLLPKVAATELPDAQTSQWLAKNTWECRVDTYSKLAAEVRQHGRPGAMALLGGAR